MAVDGLRPQSPEIQNNHGLHNFINCIWYRDNILKFLYNLGTSEYRQMHDTTLKIESCHDANFIIVDGTDGWQNDKLRYHL